MSLLAQDILAAAAPTVIVYLILQSVRFVAETGSKNFEYMRLFKRCIWRPNIQHASSFNCQEEAFSANPNNMHLASPIQT